MVLVSLGSLLSTVLVDLKRIRQQIKLKLSAEKVLVFRIPSDAERVSIQVVKMMVSSKILPNSPVYSVAME